MSTESQAGAGEAGSGAAPAAQADALRVVGVGASAGGLEALQQLFSHMPPHPGLAFVVVQHLSPDFKSLMPELLGRATTMPVVSANHDLVLEPNKVYVLAPGISLAVRDGRLLTQPRAATGELYQPINLLFESLVSLGANAAAIVLSGTGQDGTSGAKALSVAGGLVLAQSPTSARFDSMPRSVIDADCADIVALPSEMGRALVRWVEDPAAGRQFTSESVDGDALVAGPYGPVMKVLQEAFGVDFGHYKAGTIMRRLDRWLTVGGQPLSPQELADRVSGNPAEMDRLLGDLLIGVASFFRDEAAFETLRDKAIDPLVEALGEREQLRFWCCACSTGEEAYTVAMLAIEAFDRRNLAPRVRILATDLHAASVQKASTGLYTEEALASVPERLRNKYFVPQASGMYKVADHLRHAVVFSAHNVLRDAPFQRIDLVTCRNLMIYMKPSAQSLMLAAFHAALHSGGMLFLGQSEMPGEQSEAFAPVEEGAHLYRKRAGVRLPISSRPLFGVPPLLRPSASVALDNRASFRLQEVLAQRYVPAGFLVNQHDELVYVFGDAGRYLQASPGRFGGTMFSLLGGGLRTAVTMALRKAAQKLESTSVSDVVMESDEPGVTMRVDVDPIIDRSLPGTYFMVRLVRTDAVTNVAPALPGALATSMEDASAAHMAELETELQRTREALQRTVEDLEAANEELQAGNEELMAANEELQSSNEELHALNEELYSVNAEHEFKIQELRETSADLNNLIRATELPIIFLDVDCRLRLFTPPATEMFPLRAQDVGRELRDFLPREVDASLFDDIDACLHQGVSRDRELVLRNERFLRRRVSPYRTDVGGVNGVVLTYFDATDQVRAREQAVRLTGQAQVQAIIESVPHLMWTCEADGLCDFLSPQWVSYTGVPEEKQLGRGWLAQIHADDQEGLMRAWNRSVETGQPFRTRFRIRRRDGVYRWFDTQGAPQLDASGRIVKWYGSNTDVHDVQLLQDALQERDRFMQMVADSINGMVGYWDRQQRNQFANRHYLEWFGKTADEVRGKTLREVLGDEVYEKNRAYVEGALRGRPQNFEREIKKPDGTTGYLLAQYLPHVINEEVLGFVVTATDITRVQEARLLADQVFKVSPVAKLVVNEHGRMVRWNPAAVRLLGYAEDRLEGLPIEQLVPADRRARHDMLRRGYMSAPTHRPMGASGAFPLLRADGSVVEVEVDISPVPMGGRPAVIACIREISMSPHAQRRLDLAVQARTAFLAQMSHEMRTPLNAILGMSQLLELESPTRQQMDRLRRIEEACNLLLGIVNDVLDYSKMEAGGLHLEIDNFTVAELLDRSLAMVAEKARLKHLTLRTEVAPGVPPRLAGDARRVEQILVNYLSNAIKFTHVGDVSVKVSSTPAPDQRVMLKVEVVDTGVGIAAQDQEELFKPFRQIQQGHARLYGGTGLGLSICRQLARAMQGDCGVLSSPGAGSTFWFTVQLAVARQRASQPAPTLVEDSSHVRALCAGKQALLVEDNEVNRLVIRQLAESVAGLHIIEAENGTEALRLAAQQVFDLVLMDIQMPGIDGIETTRRLRRLPGYAAVPVFALSANVQGEDVTACMNAGMNGHLGKPLVIAQLLAVLDTLWGQAGRAAAEAPAASPPDPAGDSPGQRG